MNQIIFLRCLFEIDSFKEKSLLSQYAQQNISKECRIRGSWTKVLKLNFPRKFRSRSIQSCNKSYFEILVRVLFDLGSYDKKSKLKSNVQLCFCYQIIIK